MQKQIEVEKLFKIIELQEDYIKFLGEDIGRNAGFLYAHNIATSTEVVNEGIRLREEIRKAKEFIGNKSCEGVCTCGNPSEEVDVHFEGDEKFIGTCADCGKRVAD